MPKFATGLVVGKFAPLHRGHQFLLDTARAACDTLIILSYCQPEPAGCPAMLRHKWLQQHYPDACIRVLDAAGAHALGLALPPDSANDDTQRHFCADLLARLGLPPVDAIFSSEDYGPGFAAVLSQRQLRPIAHIAVDPARSKISISASQIRADLPGNRHWLSDDVAADLLAPPPARVCLLGGESSGKTSLAAALAKQLDTIWLAEYGRELWEEKSGNLDYVDLLAIGREQVRRENAALSQARHWLVCDTSPLTTLLYCQDMYGHAEAELELLAARHYEQIILCTPDFKFVQDGTRRDDAFRHQQHAWYQQELSRRGLRWIEAQGEMQDRVATVCRMLAGA